MKEIKITLTQQELDYIGSVVNDLSALYVRKDLKGFILSTISTTYKSGEDTNRLFELLREVRDIYARGVIGDRAKDISEVNLGLLHKIEKLNLRNIDDTIIKGNS